MISYTVQHLENGETFTYTVTRAEFRLMLKRLARAHDSLSRFTPGLRIASWARL